MDAPPVLRQTLIHPNDLEAALEAAYSDRVSENEFRLRRVDNTYRWHFVRWQTIQTESPEGLYRLGTAIDIHEQVLAREERDRQLRFVAEAIPDIVWSIRADGVQDYANEALTRYTGLPLDETIGAGWNRVVHPEDLPRVLDLWTKALQNGERFEMEYRLRRYDGAYRWFVARARPIQDADGNVLRWFGTSTDIDEQKRSVQEQQYLAQVSDVLSTSLDLEATLARIARIGLPLLGDWAQVDLLDESGELYTASQAHVDEAIHGALAAVRGHRALRLSTLAQARDITRSGKAQIFDELPQRSLEAIVPDAEERKLYRRAGYGCALFVPLVAGGATLGCITFVRGDAVNAYDPKLLPFAEEFARRAALAIKNARVYEREHRVAQTMQSASLPRALPEVPGIELNAVYVPGQSDAQIGGDWYDAFRLKDGRLVLSIGDVAGSGLDAAVTMSNMRQIIRGTAQVHADPLLMLNAADRALRLEDPQRFVTAFVGVFDPIAGELVYASAGHTPPLVRRANGQISELLFCDLPLGLRDRAEAHSQAATLETGDVLLLYTDGLVESSRNFGAGFAALEEALRDPDFGDAREPAEFLRDRILATGARDDVAILTVRVGEPAVRRRAVTQWHYDGLSAQSLSVLRKELSALLATFTEKADALLNAELVLGELAGNVVRHSGGAVDVILDLGSRDPVLHIIDEGPGFARAPMLPSDILSESGRGLFIVSQVTREFSVARRSGRGSHARAVLLV